MSGIVKVEQLRINIQTGRRSLKLPVNVVVTTSYSDGRKIENERT
jgi:hypothetical protein